MKVLYFFPNKFFHLTDGMYTRVVTVLEYLKNRGFEVDMISFENDKLDKSYVEENSLVNKIVYVKKTSNKIDVPKNIFLFLNWKLQNQIKKVFPYPKQSDQLPNYMTENLVTELKLLNEQNRYDLLLVSYIYWADIAKELKAIGFKGNCVIDPNDFLTLQQYYYHSNNLSFSNIGKFFGEELERLNQFDKIMHISYDELLLFSSFLPKKKHYFIPQFFESNNFLKAQDYNYDILFIGSDNIYNIEGIEWFFEQVYPLLDKKVRIAIAGNICNKINIIHTNIFKLGFVEDISMLYKSTKCTICPLKRGSGMKIKVVESLRYGIPVVSTKKGVDGFVNKKYSKGLLVADTAESFAINLNLVINAKLEVYSIHSEAAKELFDENFSVEKIFQTLDEVFEFKFN